MDISVERDDSARRIRITVTGRLDVAGLMECARAIRAPDVEGHAVTWDLREAMIGATGLSLVALREGIVALDGARPLSRPIALLVDSETAFSMAGAYVLLARMAGDRVKAFRDPALAERWLESGGPP